MKKIILLTLILILVSNIESYSKSPFRKKKHWFGFGLMYSDPQRELRFGKYYQYGIDGNICYRYVLKENFELGLTAEYGTYTFSQEKFERVIYESEPPGDQIMETKTKNGTMFTIYTNLYINALPKFNREMFFSVGLGYYRLFSPEIRWRLYDLEGNPFQDPDNINWHVGTSPKSIEKLESAPGFNLGINYDHRIYKEIRVVFDIRYHQLLMAEDAQNFAKIKFGFLF